MLQSLSNIDFRKIVLYHIPMAYATAAFESREAGGTQGAIKVNSN